MSVMSLWKQLCPATLTYGKAFVNINHSEMYDCFKLKLVSKFNLICKMIEIEISFF